MITPLFLIYRDLGHKDVGDLLLLELKLPDTPVLGFIHFASFLLSVEGRVGFVTEGPMDPQDWMADIRSAQGKLSNHLEFYHVGEVGMGW